VTDITWKQVLFLVKRERERERVNAAHNRLSSQNITSDFSGNVICGVGILDFWNRIT
jgi:hypothetical protein